MAQNRFPNNFFSFRMHNLSIFIIFVIVFAMYGPILSHQFAGWDDSKYIDYIWKPTWEKAWDLVTDFNVTHKIEYYYNPLHFLSLMLDQTFVTGDQPSAVVSKGMNVFFHICCSILVYFFLYNIFRLRFTALIGALIFAVHPLQVETVAWVAERKNLLFSAFFLISCLCFSRYLDTNKAGLLVFVVISFVLGLLSKPSAVTFPLIAILIGAYKQGYAILKERAVVFCFILLLSIAQFRGLFVISTEQTAEGLLPSLLYRPVLAAGIILFYISKFLFPLNLSPIYPRWDIVDNVWIFSLLFVVLISLIAILLYYRSRLNKWISFGLLFFLVNISLTSGLFPFSYMSQSFVADHFMYLPILGLIIAAMGFLSPYIECETLAECIRKPVFVILSMVILILVCLSVNQSYLWSNPKVMWRTTLERNPNSYAAQNNYGYLLMSSGQYDEAEDHFKKAMKIAPTLAIPYNNLGMLYILKKDLPIALTYYRTSAKLNPDQQTPFVMQARILRNMGQKQAAIDFMEKLLNEKPQFFEVRYELGLHLYQEGREDEALKQLYKVIETEPYFPDSYYQLGALLLSKGEPEKAIPLLEKALRFSNKVETYNVLGVAYAHLDNCSKALDNFYVAYKMRPSFPGLKDNIANALMDCDKYSEARSLCSNQDLIPCNAETNLRIKSKHPTE
jgi:protein O-mannosyl-transferase